MKHLPLLIALILVVNPASAQTKPQYEQRVYQDSTGKMYWNKNLPVYLSISTSPNDEKYNLESNNLPDCDNPFYFDTEGPNYLRTRWAVDKETKAYVHPRQELLWEVIADSKAPVSRADITNTATFKHDGKTYYKKNAQVELSAKDVTSGIDQIQYSINEKPYQKYDTPIILTEAGDYKIKYFAVDWTGNAEDEKEITFSIDDAPPSTLCVITGVKLGEENIISKTSRLHLEYKDTDVGVKQSFYAIDGSEFKLYNGQNIPTSYLKDGKHTLTFYSVDKVGNKEQEQEYSFYLDKTAPITASDVLGDRFTINGQTYFSGRTRMKLTAVDNKSGVKEIFYSVNGGPFKRYTDPFYLPNKAGIHIVRYFATDNTENIATDAGSTAVYSKYMEYRHKVDKVYIDLLGPVISYNMTGPRFRDRDTLFISPETQIHFTARDTESGLHHISYTLDQKQGEITYNSPFSLDISSGAHQIEYFAYDNVNNRNIGTFDIILDKSGPEISHKFSIVSSGMQDSTEAYPAYSKLFLSAQDDLTGIKQIYYSLNGSPNAIYRSYISGFKKGRINVVKVKVLDMLDNESETEIKFFAN